MAHYARYWWCGLMLASFAGAALAEDDPWQLLERAGQAAHKLSYKGIFVYHAGSVVSNMQITHVNYPMGEFARVVSLDGAPREVLRQGNEAVIYSPQQQKVMIEKRHLQNSFPALLPSLSDTLRNSYEAHVVGQERVGGRDGTVVQLAPRDKLRYGYRFSLDREFGLLLKSVMMNERGEPVEQVAFSQLLLMPTLDMDWFHPNVERGKDYVMQPAEQVAPAPGNAEGWVVASLPAGYVKVDQVIRSLPGKPVPVSQWVFSDGISSVSLFIEPIDKGAAPPRTGRLQQGATHVYVNTVGNYQVVVVGEVPEAVVRQIADAVSLKK